MLKHIAIAFTLASVVGVAACSPAGAPGSADKGAEKVAARAERKQAATDFGVTATPPEGWYVMDTKVTEQLMDAGQDVVMNDADATTKAAMEASIKRTSNIFGYMKFAPGKPVENNANILAMAENIGFLPGIERGSDYFFHVRKSFGMTNMDIKVADGYQIEKIDGRDFDRMDVTLTMMGRTATQRYYAARHGDSIICFILSYTTDEDRQTLEKVLQGIKLAW